jgi:TonB family protein
MASPAAMPAAEDGLPFNVTMRAGERSGERLYQPRFPWWEPFETRVYPVIRKERNGSLTLLLRLAIQADRKPGLRAVAFQIDGATTTLPFKKPWVDRLGCRVEEYLEIEGQEALIRRLAYASDARAIFTTAEAVQEQVLSATQRDGFAAVLRLYGTETVPEPEAAPLKDKDLTLPRIQHRVTPEFPADLVARQRRGRVVVHAKIHTDGGTEVLDVMESDAPYCGFEESALQAIGQWRYIPGMKNGEPVEFNFTIDIDFTFR